jgi:glucose/arabinose dehydrogenase
MVLAVAAAPFLFPGTSPAGSNGSTPTPPFLSEGAPGVTGTTATKGAATAEAVAAAATLPAGFTDSIALSGLTNPTNVRFASDGRIFVAEKSGLLKVFDSLSDTTPTVVADFRTETHNFWDRGLLGLALDPNFPATPSVYLLYTYDAPPGQVAPVWNDGCPTPPGATTDGCLATAKLVKIQLSGNTMVGNPTTLISGEWCQQYPSHSIGDLQFGPDGALYVSGGDGASFTFIDYGQGGGGAGSPTPKNPCGDPPVPVGGTQTAPNAQGGALRSQSPRRPGSGGGGGPSGVELLPNPGAEANVTGWRQNSATVTRATTPVHSGTGSVKVVTANTLTTEGTYQFTANGSITPGTTYRTSAWVNAPSGAKLKLGVEWINSSGGFVNLTQSSFTGTGGWAQQTFDAVAPAGSDHVAYYIYTDGVKQALTFNIDDASMQSLTGGGGGSGPVVLNGAVLRVSPTTGLALPDNPNAASSDVNARRIIAYGFRNPFRFTFRPGTSELWIGDVGMDTWEEINRRITPTGPVQDFGWPCYEGTPIMPGYQAANLNICSQLYATPGAVTAPYFSYKHGLQVVSGETCPTGNGSVISALAFYAGGSYPSTYNGALFFGDHSRNCIWVMMPGANGLPDPNNVQDFIQGAGHPVDLEVGPNGDLFYADFEDGTIQRITYSATTCNAGVYTATYFNNETLTGSPALTRCEPTINNTWGSGSPDPSINADGFSARWTGNFSFAGGPFTFTATTDDGMRVFVDGTAIIDQWHNQTSATTYTATTTLSAGTHQVKVEYYEHTGSATAQVSWAPGTTTNNPPSPSITTPASTVTYAVGDSISFSGGATDPEDGTIPASGLSWKLIVHHCTTPTDCHTHDIQTFSGSSGSFNAPDHDYPSFLELQLTATDSGGASATTSVNLQPKTVNLTFNSNPSGLSLAVGASQSVTPFTRTVIVNSANSLGAPSPQTLGGTSYTFSSWSDGGAASHTITAPATATTYTATYTSSGGGGGTELLPNPTFDTDISGWRQNSATLTRDTGTVHTGAGSLKIVTNNTIGTEGTYTPRSAAGTVTGGTAYTFSVWANAAATAQLKIGVEWYSSTGTFLGLNQSNFNGTGGWSQASMNATAPSGASSFVLFVYTANLTQALTFYLDDASAKAS